MFNPRHPLRYQLSRCIRQTSRTLRNVVQHGSFATHKSQIPLSVIIQKMETPIYRRLPSVSPILFENKKINLMIALQSLNGIQIQPGETFSFWWLVGSPTAKRGYQKGLVIQQGRAEKGWGGGLCQLSNMIHYLALHSDLEIVERHRHSFDLFPDDNRIIPFGTGATVSFNYKDLQIHNPTDWTYQMLFEMDDKRLAGGLLCSELPDRRYVVLERGQGFKQVNGVYWRENTVIRIINDLKLGLVGEEVLFRNKCECRYNPREVTN